MSQPKPWEPVPFSHVLHDELRYISERRKFIRESVQRRIQEETDAKSAGDHTADAPAARDGQTQEPTASSIAEKQARLEALDSHVTGLAMSGGGIRSATFGLGVLQGLADLKILSRFDYLSTVSGGGYIGAWLAAWLKREAQFLDVEDQLSPSRITEAAVDRNVIGRKKIIDEEPEPIRHLRSYSNYLTPRRGLLTVDTWTVLVIYVRNTLINLLLLAPLAMLLVLFSRLLVSFYAISFAPDWLRNLTFWGFFALLTGVVLALGRGLYKLQKHTANGARSEAPVQVRTLHVTVIGPLIIAAFLACWTFSLPPPPTEAARVRKDRLKGNFDISKVRLIHLAQNGRGVQSTGTDQVVIADAENLLHFRIFDATGKIVVDADEDQLKQKGLAAPLVALRRRLRPLWPPHQLTDEERDEITEAVTSIFDHPHFETRLPDGPKTAQASSASRNQSLLGIPNRLREAVHNLQPYIDETPFPILERLPEFRQNAYVRWYIQRRFLWVSPLESGIFFGTLAALVHLCGYGLLWKKRFDPDTLARQRGETRNRLIGFFWMTSSALIAGFTGGFLFLAMASEVLWRLYDQPHAIITVGPPLALLTFVTATFIEAWLLGRWQDDDLREWWARICAWLVIAACAWFGFFAVTLYGPLLVNRLLSTTPLKSGALLAWLATAASGAIAGRRPEAAPRRGRRWLRALVMIAPPAFLVGLLVVVAMLVNNFVFDWFTDRLVRLHAEGADSLPDDPSAAWAYWNGVLTSSWQQLLWVAGWCLGLAAIASWMSNVNLFSLNSMYANRLTRCYLGASRKKSEWTTRGKNWSAGTGGAPTGVNGAMRQENPVTGFDLADDIPLWMLKIGLRPESHEQRHFAPEGYYGPQLILNTALNIVSGSELAWQDRKAESFVLTPTYCGSKGTGYAPTTAKTGRRLTLGRAVSISGAAVDSNIGLHQSSALIALMTALNARLGWWLRNPNRPDWDARSPSVARPLLWELFGLTDAKKEYIHLSDGGHFENLGVYELIRRRCRYIVCCDAGTDHQAADDNLANMIRLCRTDFGVRIEIDTAPFARDGATGLARWHCVVGRIRYDDVDDGELPGILVLLRTTLTGDEPPDVQEYAAKNPSFPWQSTADQFFDESQFESYRALGFHVAQAAFKDALDDVRLTEPLWSNDDAETEFRRGNQRLFSATQRRWAPAPSNLDGAFLAAAESWTRFQEALRRDPKLTALSDDIYPEQDFVRHPAPVAKTGAAAMYPGSPELHAVAQLIQAMESAWVGLRLSGFRNLPMNRGWMSVFRRWSGTHAVRRYWPVLRLEYSQDFVKFCETQLGLGVVNKAILLSKLDKAFVAASLDALSGEYAREWPCQPTLETLLDEVKSRWTNTHKPIPVWLLVQATHTREPLERSPDKVPCGIILGKPIREADPAKGQLARYEVFIWVRRAYRSMGIVSRTAPRALAEFSDMIHTGQPTPFDFTVEARYPIEKTERGDEMEFNLWRNFFGHFDFRCSRGSEKKRDGYWVVERTFKSDQMATRHPGNTTPPDGRPLRPSNASEIDEFVINLPENGPRSDDRGSAIGG